MRTHSLLGDVLKWPPDLLVSLFFRIRAKARTLDYSAAITTTVDRVAAQHDLRTSRRQGV